jgi:holliday junction DNA helicase RuvB
MNIHKMFARLIVERNLNGRLFDKIIGCEDIRRLFRIALGSAEPVHILLSGAPASAKTLFLQSLMTLKDSYFVDGSNTTKSGMIDYIFDNKPKYLLIDEIDKMASKDQTFLLNLMETGMVTETKHRKTRAISSSVTFNCFKG